MKLLRQLLKLLFIVIAVLIFILFVLVYLDSRSTSYLDINSELVANNSHLITNVNIVPMDQDTVLRNKMVHVKDGIIEEIADSIEVDSIEILDAQNKYLTPGLIDMHVHIWDKFELGLYLANGVTSVRNLWGMPIHLRIKNDVNHNRIFSPSFFTSGPKLTGVEFIGSDNLNLLDPAEAKAKVLAYKERGYDFIKTYYGLDRDIFDAVIEQAEASDIDIVAHPSQKVPFSYHLHPRIKSIEHAEEIVQQALKFELKESKLKSIIDTISYSEHISYCPTIVVFNNIYQMMINDSILDSDSLRFINPLIRKVDSKKQFDRWFNAKQSDPSEVNRIKDQHNFHIAIVQQLHNAGVNIICGTDAGIGVTLPGFSIHKELKFYKEAGLSNYEVLKTATINASKVHSLLNRRGSIEEGKIADMLLLEENPLLELSSLEKPSYVFVIGRKLNKKTLDGFASKAMERNNLIPSVIRYLEYLVFERKSLMNI